MKLEFKADTAGFERAVKRLAELQRKEAAAVLKTAAKGFIRTTMDWTPPGSPGRSGSKARKAGEQAAKSDLAKLFLPTRKPVAATSMQAIHEAARDRRGRVRRVREKTLVAAADYRRYQKLVMGRVGWLASGWNAAAVKLGVRVPAWIARHGSSAGQVAVKLEGWSPSVEIINRVKYGGEVKDLKSRIARALESQRKSMERQIKWLTERNAKKSGL
jgi:hypothetical protein